MNSSRRLFLAQASIAAGAVVLNKHLIPFNRPVNPGEDVSGDNKTLTIYHTNKLNGHTGPVYKNSGGFARIDTHIHDQESKGLLLDAGGFLNNDSRIEEQRNIVGMMNGMGYKAVAVSGLDLSGDGNQLAALMQQMQFSLINCNHRFNNGLKSFVKSYCVIKANGLKVGLTGVCRPLKGAKYVDAIECANRTAHFLKEDERCNFVICFSDLGLGGGESELSDQKLAATSEQIDLIIGTDRGKPESNNFIMHNKLKQEVIFSAAASRGLTIGKTVVTFNDEKRKQGISVEHIIPAKPADQNFGAALRELSLA